MSTSSLITGVSSNNNKIWQAFEKLAIIYLWHPVASYIVWSSENSIAKLSIRVIINCCSLLISKLIIWFVLSLVWNFLLLLFQKTNKIFLSFFKSLNAVQQQNDKQMKYKNKISTHLKSSCHRFQCYTSYCSKNLLLLFYFIIYYLLFSYVSEYASTLLPDISLKCNYIQYWHTTLILKPSKTNKTSW